MFRRNILLSVRFLHDRKLPSVKPPKKISTKIIGTLSPKKANYNSKKISTKIIGTLSPKKANYNSKKINK